MQDVAIGELKTILCPEVHNLVSLTVTLVSHTISNPTVTVNHSFPNPNPNPTLPLIPLELTHATPN
jgi:hypothetical protein